MDVTGEPLRSRLSQAQTVVLVGDAEALEAAVSERMSDETRMEVIDEEGLSSKLEGSVLEPPLPS